MDIQSLKGKVNDILDNFEQKIQTLPESKKNLKRIHMLEKMYLASIEKEDDEPLQKKIKLEEKYLKLTQRYGKLVEMYTAVTRKHEELLKTKQPSMSATSESSSRNPNYRIVPMQNGGNIFYKVLEAMMEPQDFSTSSTKAKSEASSPTEFTPTPSFTLPPSFQGEFQPEKLGKKS